MYLGLPDSNAPLMKRTGLLAPEIVLTIFTESDSLANLQFFVGRTFAAYVAFIYQQHCTGRVIS